MNYSLRWHLDESQSLLADVTARHPWWTVSHDVSTPCILTFSGSFLMCDFFPPTAIFSPRLCSVHAHFKSQWTLMIFHRSGADRIPDLPSAGWDMLLCFKDYTSNIVLKAFGFIRCYLFPGEFKWARWLLLYKSPMRFFPPTGLNICKEIRNVFHVYLLCPWSWHRNCLTFYEYRSHAVLGFGETSVGLASRL